MTKATSPVIILIVALLGPKATLIAMEKTEFLGEA